MAIEAMLEDQALLFLATSFVSQGQTGMCSKLTSLPVNT